jgi:hypothetical protein
MTRIPVDVPTSDARRDRIERDVLAQVAAMRAADRADARVPRGSRRLWWLGGAALAAAAIVLVIVLGRGDHTSAVAFTPSRVVTPAGGTSRFTVEDAVIDAGSDTNVEVRRDPDGAVRLVLARGSVDCDVAPRAGRAPFRVVTGDVTVEVVGTRFTVARRPAVRVDVARGKVRVTTPTGTTYVAAGESWPEITAEAAPVPVPVPVPVPDEPAPAPPPAPAPDSHAAYQAASKLLVKSPPQGMRALRGVADGRSTWAALALYDLAEAHASADPDAALRELAEYERRFPHGANAEEAAWGRIDILRSLHRTDEMRRASADFVQKYPGSVYVESARRLATP